MARFQNFINVANTYARVFRHQDFEYKREAFEYLSNQLKDFNIVIVGLRQIGKTTLATQLMKEYLGNRLDKVMDNQEVVEDFEPIGRSSDEFLYLNMKALETFDTTELLEFISQSRYKIVFLDEIQMVSSWTNFSQSLIDANPNTRFILSGSNTAALTKEIMLNRAKVFLMSPLSFNEYKAIWKDESENAIQTFLKYGSFPIAKGYSTVDHQYLETIEQHIIDRIITEDFTISKISKFKLLMKKMVGYIGNDLKLSNIIDNDDGFTRQTAKDYLTIMERSGLVKTIHKHNDASNKPIQKAYFADKSMIYKFNNFGDLNNNLMGSLVENVVFNYLDKEFNKRFSESNIYSFRNSNKKEIDFIVPNDNLLIEVKHIDADKDQWREVVEEYQNRCEGKFESFNKIIITKDFAAQIDGWRLIPFAELLIGGIDVLRGNK